MFSERRGISGGGTRRAAAKKTKMAAVRLPPARERKRPNGDGFAPRPMIRTRKGRLRKGGAGGKTQAGETAAPRLPATPSKTHGPRVPQGSGTRDNGAPSPRRRRDSAAPRWHGAWARLIPRKRSERIARPTYAKRPPRKVFHARCGKYHLIGRPPSNRIHCGFNRFSICLILSIALSRTHSVISVSAISRRTFMLALSPIDPNTTTAAL